MAIDPSTLDLVASCLEYPEPGGAARARAAASGLASSEPELSAALFGLAVFLERAEPGEAEERYTALFDMNPVCTLHVGYHVFGDSYPRGELLAALLGELRAAAVPTGGELADFLPTLLRLLGRLSDGEDRRALRQLALVPALRRMRELLAASKDPWSALLCALPAALAEEGDPVEAPQLEVAAQALGRRPPATDAGCAPPSCGPRQPATW